MEARPTPHDPSGTIKLSTLFLTFLKVGLFSFGGGLSGWIYQEVVIRRRWMTAEDFLSGLTIAQLLPGANVTNIAIYVGNRGHGMIGAAMALAGLLTGPFLVVIGIAEAFSWLSRFPGFDDFLDGVAAAAVGLMLMIGLQAARVAFSDPRPAAIFLAVFVCIGVLGTPLVATVLVAGVLSVALSWRRRTDA